MCLFSRASRPTSLSRKSGCLIRNTVTKRKRWWTIVQTTISLQALTTVMKSRRSTKLWMGTKTHKWWDLITRRTPVGRLTTRGIASSTSTAILASGANRAPPMILGSLRNSQGRSWQPKTWASTAAEMTIWRWLRLRPIVISISLTRKSPLMECSWSMSFA